ncbi:MAG: hydroxymethylbilane synthase [Acidobacteriota bacterium]
MKLRLGTRGSLLARTQSGWVGQALIAAGHEVETVVVETRGDQQRDRPFAAIGAPGVFVRELERALEDRRVDLVVHSYKDLPSASPEGLVIAAVPERLDSADRLLARPGAIDLDGAAGPLPLVRGARLGTASARRQALVLDLRPDLEVALLRGNVPTRLAKLVSGEYDAILLAAAGLDRLDRAGGDPRHGVVEMRLDPSVFVPAPSQGALAVQVRDGDDGDDGAIRRAVSALDDAGAHRCVRAERRLLERVEGGCNVPFGAWCRADAEGRLQLDAIFGEGDGVLRRASGQGDDPVALADALAPALLSKGTPT